ncbi:MAG TPA: glycosyltransferase family 39 protein [Blastocatellia bacterium]
MNQDDKLPTGVFAHAVAREDRFALLALAVLFAAMLAASWQRWTQPLLDHGREMNLPTRILAGEHLYSDVQFLYGPFAPHFNALLYRIFGIHLATLKVSGAICALLILLMIYWLSRRLMSVWEATLATGLVLVICAVKSTANYIQPYAYAALYGFVFALASLVCTIRFVQSRRQKQMIWAGVFAGLSLISKPEIALAAWAAAGIALLTESVSVRKPLAREALYFILPVVVIFAAAYGFILSHVPLEVLLQDNHVLFTNMPPQLIYFNRHISGLAKMPTSIWFTLTGIAIFGIWAGASAVIGAALSGFRRREGWGYTLKVSGLVLLIAAVWREAAIRFLKVPDDVTPFASAIIVLPLVIGALGWRVWKTRKADQPVPVEQRILIVLAVFSLFSVLRALLNVTTTGPYTPFFIPALIVVYLYLLFRAAPAFLAPALAVRATAQRVLMCLVALLVIGLAVNSAIRFRKINTYEVSSARGSFVTLPEIGQPLAAAIRYAEEHTRPGEYVLALPVATTINFLAARPYPLREEIVHPGFLTDEKEIEAIERIKSRQVPLVLVANQITAEFRDRVFGADYNQELMRWITENYHLVARFETPHRQGANFSNEPFFILAYERNP